MSTVRAETEPSKMAEIAMEVLAPQIGRFTARKAIELAAHASMVNVTQLSPQHEEIVIDTLRPMLRTLLGARTAERILAKFQRRIDTEVRA